MSKTELSERQKEVVVFAAMTVLVLAMGAIAAVLVAVIVAVARFIA